MQRLELTVHDPKTRLGRVPDESFDFLGYTIGRCYSPKTGRAFLGTRPSRKQVNRLCREISALTSGSWSKDVAAQVAAINHKLRGWSTYFCLGQVSPAYGAVDYHVVRRLCQWLCKKHQVRGAGCHGSRPNTCTSSWVWSDSVGPSVPSRERTHESLSASRRRA